MDTSENYIHNVIAVVGASTNPQKYGYRIFHDLVLHNYNVYGVNINGGEIAGKKLYTSLKDLPKTPDIVITVVPPSVTVEVIKEAKQLSIPVVWMQPGSESAEAIELCNQLAITPVAKCFMTTNGIW